MKPVKKVAILHDMCGVGKAALTNMLPILSILGIEACPIPTMLLSTHTGGYGVPVTAKTAPEYVKDCAEHYAQQQVEFDAIFVGYLGNEDMVDAIQYFVSRFPGTPVLMDPIMGDHGKYYSNFDERYGRALRELLPYANIILPNITEACLLTESSMQQVYTGVDIKKICSKLRYLGARDIVITSVPTVRNNKGIALFEKNCLTILDKEELPSEYHGTGDAFDGVLLANYMKDISLFDCINRAHQFVCACIIESSKYEYPEREGLIIEKNLHMLV